MPQRTGYPSDAARFLLVDADQQSARTLAGELPTGFAMPVVVVEAPTGTHAIEVLRAGRFDIVLVDLTSVEDIAPTPEDAVARLVRFAEGALTIALSDGASVSATMAAMRAGAHYCAARPISGAALAQRIGELARRHGKPRLVRADVRTAAADVSAFNGASDQMHAVSQLVGHDLPESVEDLHGLVRRLALMLEESEAAETTVASEERPPSRDAARERRAPILPMWRQEQRIIEEAIARYSGNVALAAAALELSPSTIYRKRQAWAEMEAQKGAA